VRGRDARLHAAAGPEGAPLRLIDGLLCAAVAAGCAAAPPPSATPPARVVSLAPSITEIAYALGAGDRLVGVCGGCDRPAAVARLPRVGGYLAPSVEATLGLAPDLVLAVPSPGNREAVRAIERVGVRVLVVHDRTLPDLWASIRDIAGALGMPAAGDRLAADLRAGLDAVHARVARLPVRRVLVIVGHDPLVAVGGDTLQDALVGIAGGVNVAADAGSVWPRITLELVVARAPDVIVDAAMGDEAAGRALFAGLETVPAVREGRIVTLPTDALFRAGPRVPEAARALAAAIHPEAFGPEAARG
jgi:iron complex transport system substrate-binding protein